MVEQKKEKKKEDFFNVVELPTQHERVIKDGEGKVYDLQGVLTLILNKLYVLEEHLRG